jgi:hypothetical protein
VRTGYSQLRRKGRHKREDRAPQSEITEKNLREGRVGIFRIPKIKI